MISMQHDHMMWTRVEYMMRTLFFDLNCHNIQGMAAWYAIGDEII